MSASMSASISTPTNYIIMPSSKSIAEATNALKKATLFVGGKTILSFIKKTITCQIALEEAIEDQNSQSIFLAFLKDSCISSELIKAREGKCIQCALDDLEIPSSCGSFFCSDECSDFYCENGACLACSKNVAYTGWGNYGVCSRTCLYVAKGTALCKECDVQLEPGLQVSSGLCPVCYHDETKCKVCRGERIESDPPLVCSENCELINDFPEEIPCLVCKNIINGDKWGETGKVQICKGCFECSNRYIRRGLRSDDSVRQIYIAKYFTEKVNSGIYIKDVCWPHDEIEWPGWGDYYQCR
jgi:hypothetical protein